MPLKTGELRASTVLKQVSWLLPAAIGCLLAALPAEAAKLQFWRFDATRNQLVFRTEAGVQPQAQLIANPTRLVIDLPGIVLGRPTITQTVEGTIKAVRVAQFDPQTTRIVIELAPGYTMDPEQVKFRGATPRNWSVQLPQPIATSEPSSSPDASPSAIAQVAPRNPVSPPGNLSPPSSQFLPTPPVNSSPPTSQFVPTRPASTTSGSQVLPTPPQNVNSGAQISQTPPRNNLPGQLTDLQVTPDGLFLNIPGRSPRVEVRRRGGNRRVDIDLTGVTLSAAFKQKRFTLNRFGVTQVEIDPRNNFVRLSLMVSANSPDWDATVSNLGGVVIIPRGGASAIPRNNAPQNTYSLLTGASFAQSTPPPAAAGNFSTIQDIDVGSNQLLIRADRLSSYTIRWEGRSYRITLRSTQLSDQLQSPRLGAGSPLEDIQLQQIDPQTVSILLTPAPGVRLIGPRPLDSQSLLVQLYRAGSPIPPPVNPRSPTVTQIPTSPQFPSSPPIQTPTEPPPIRNTSGRRVVVIDPGHGGPDPGAIGIGGIREKDLVLDMSLEVARVLQQQGVIVRLTRPDDRDLDLAPRVAIAERTNADVFVSIHANAVSLARPDINGVETFAAPGRPRSRQLATLIQNSILARFNMVDRGVKIARFYVIRNTSMPSALVETGFVTGANDARNLASPAWRREMAQAIARGILQYLQSGR